MKVKVNEYRTERLLVAKAAATVAVALRALTSGIEAVHAEHVLETFGRYEFRGIRLPQGSGLNPATTAARPRVTGMILFRRSVQLERAACNVVELMPVEGLRVRLCQDRQYPQNPGMKRRRCNPSPLCQSSMHC